jgi:hypothetical protein
MNSLYDLLLQLCWILLLLCWILWPVNITWTGKRGVQEAGPLISQYELILLHQINLLCYVKFLFHHVINSCISFMIWIHISYFIILIYWNHMCNSCMLFIFIDSVLHPFNSHTDRANGIPPNDPFPFVILVLLERQVLAACNELIIWISTMNLVYELILWISNMNSVYEIYMFLLDVRLLAAPTVLAPHFNCRDRLPFLCLCPAFT